MTTEEETERPSPPTASRAVVGLFAAGFLFLEATIGLAIENVSSLRNAIVVGILVAVVALTTYLRELNGDLRTSPGWWRWLSARRWPGVLFLLATVALLIATSLWTISQPAAAECPFPANGPGVSTAAPQGESHGLTFCPIRVGNGLPITGPFKVEGKIIGPKNLRENLLLAVAIDPYTCSADGKPGIDATFPLPKVVLTTDDGSWSYVDDLGNDPEGVTLGRTFQFLGGSASGLAALREVPSTWKRLHGNAPGYSGVAKLPNGVQALASFYVAGGQYDGRKACKAL